MGKTLDAADAGSELLEKAVATTEGRLVASHAGSVWLERLVRETAARLAAKAVSYTHLTLPTIYSV